MTRRRVDPRAERAARTVMAGPRPRLLREPPAGGAVGPRRDPRARRAAALVRVTPRRRYDWTREGLPAASAPAAVPVAPAREVVPEVPLRVIADPAFLVLVVLDCPDGLFGDHDRELVAAGRILADAEPAPGAGAVVTVAAVREAAREEAARNEAAGGEAAGAEFGAAGSDRHVALPAGWAAGWCPEARADAVVALIGRLKPRHVLFPESPDGGDLARRVAAATGERLFPGVDSLTAGRAARPVHGGSREAARAPARLMTIAAEAVAPLQGVRHEARPLDPPAVATTPRLIDPRPLPVDADALALSESEFLLSGGNGVTDWAAFAELARLLGATRAGTRVVCDAGHLPRSRQVGASGTVVTARCYLAMGIAGAPQHLQGIPGVRHVIAVNTDLHAAMVKRADLAIVADAQAVMPALIRLLREKGHG